ncbi:NADPH-dependent glutamate synthase [Pseudodesulfovibrio cashew]|uniref:NADPH-dependent glutamate synthase n=2 Tax=Pseudodesulfovibrio cashew TaxID=2678688 RepID=A0A6I6JPP3_9BACT|nr:NADPH-dependent glutamate synthase [Pseudodesulfovibrio cashew]
MAIPRKPMPVQEPEARVLNFEEVATGYTPEMAQEEAERCLQCKDPKCSQQCPVQVDIPQFIAAVRDGDMAEAVSILKGKNNLPAICGRVCPQEVQCESGCILGIKGKPVAIGRLERFVGDYELSHKTLAMTRAASTGRKVAVVGSGPAGLACAVDLGRLGHDVTIFEALHLPGGVLAYGIPEFRLPKDVIGNEIKSAAEALDIKIRRDHVIGNTLTIDELLEEFDAVFLGTGAGLPVFLNIPGVNLNGVMSANELLTRVNLMKGYRFPAYDTPVKVGRNVAVIGAGNVAMDAVRCVRRLQAIRAGEDGDAGEVHVVYRRSADEVPARREEVHHAAEEGVIFDFLTNPVAILGDESGAVRALQCVRMELGEPDASGRRRPVAIEGSDFELEVDQVIFALGTNPNPLVFSNADDLKRNKRGTVEASDESGLTTKPGVWAGGDVVTGAATVISAMGAGKRAAADIHEYLCGLN